MTLGFARTGWYCADRFVDHIAVTRGRPSEEVAVFLALGDLLCGHTFGAFFSGTYSVH